MKKTIKVILVIILIVACSLTSYQIGRGSASLKADDHTSNYEFNKLKELENLIDKNFLFDIDKNHLEEGVYKGLFMGLNDPYSVYMNKDEFDRLMESTSGEYAGVGIVVTAGEDNRITVVSPIDGTPASKADIRTDDKIIAVNGEQFLGSELDKAVDIMRGEPGTDVVLTIHRISENKNDIFDITLTREKIIMETVKSKIIDDIGYIAIAEFDENTYNEFIDHLDELDEKGINALVIDLRGNPGGLLDSVCNIADELLPQGIIMKTVDKNGKELTENSDADHWSKPLSVIINKGSASASEILAGAIQDYQRGKIIGETSFGKGIVQKIFTLPDGTGAKLTISEYFTPKGTKIHEKGVIPDIEVILDEDVDEIGPDFLKQDIQLQKAIDVLK